VYSLIMARLVIIWLICGLFLIFLARNAYSSVDTVSSRQLADGLMVAIRQVFVRPPSESCSRRVSLDSLSTAAPVRTLFVAGTVRMNVAAPIGDVGRVLDKLVDDATQGQQTLVDVARLLGARACGA
jgi:hypothetical protein